MGSSAIISAIEAAAGPAVCAYLTAGYPTLDQFGPHLDSVARAADVVEVGVPFTDPMADGMTVQRASHTALENGVTLSWILDVVGSSDASSNAPILLMGYYNPFLAFGLDNLGPALADAGVSGLIVPDLPFDESADLVATLQARDIALVQLVTPTTPPDRLERLAQASGGFVYAVSMTGVTGGTAAVDAATTDYLSRVREMASLPVLAGFGIKTREQVASLAELVDGVVVGSALIEAVDRGEDPGSFVSSLRPESVTT